MTDTLIQSLIENFMRFPGIGPRQAKRFVYYLLHASPTRVSELLKQIEELKKYSARCPDCGRFYYKQNLNSPIGACEICSDQNRDKGLLMLVEKDIDLENIMKTDTYHGQFFVLGGLIKILDKTPELSIRSKDLLTNLEKRAKNRELKEVIAALAATEEGDHTVEFIRKYLEPVLVKYQIKFSTLGRGLSTGVELEYSDAVTLKQALRHRG